MAPRNCFFVLSLRLALVLFSGWVLSGCALQSDVMEIDLDVEAIQDLQRKLETQLTHADEAAETVRAMRVRMDTVEDKLKEGMNPELETRVNVGLRTLERSQRQLTAARVQVEDRLSEAETFFVGQVQEVSAKQSGVEERVSTMESRLGGALRKQAIEKAASKDPADDPYGEWLNTWQWLDERITRLADNVGDLERHTEDAITRMDAPQEQVKDPQIDALEVQVKALQAKLSGGSGALTPAQVAALTGTLEPRITALEKQTVEQTASAEKLQQKRLDQIAEAVDLRLAQLEQKQSNQAQPMAAVGQRVARQDQVLVALDQRMTTLAAAMEGAAGPTAAQLVQLSQRMDGLEQTNQVELTQLKGTLNSVVAKVGPDAPSGGEAAALAGLSGQMELLAASLDARLARLEQAAGGSASQQQVVTHVDGRFQELEPRFQQISERMSQLEQAQMADMAELSQRVAGSAKEGRPDTGPASPGVLQRMERQEQALTLLERRLAAVQTDPQVAFLTDRLEVLSRKLDERMARPDAGPPSGEKKVVSDPSALAGLTGQVAMLEAQLGDRISGLEQRLDQQADAPRAATPDAQLDDRIHRLEQRLDQQADTPQADPASALAGLTGQVAMLEAQLGDRINGLEQRLDQQPDAPQTDSASPEQLLRQDQAITLLDRRLTALQADPQGAFLSDRLDTLAHTIDQRLTPLETRSKDAADKTESPPVNNVALAGLSGQLALLEASLDDRIERLDKRVSSATETTDKTDAGGRVDDLGKRLTDMGARMQRLEQAQMADMSELRQRLSALSKAVAARGSDAP